VLQGGNISPFAPGNVVTVEPGIYFYPTLLTPAFSDPTKSPFLNQEALETLTSVASGSRMLLW
jgi:hypothetical protein